MNYGFINEINFPPKLIRKNVIFDDLISEREKLSVAAIFNELNENKTYLEFNKSNRFLEI